MDNLDKSMNYFLIRTTLLKKLMKTMQMMLATFIFISLFTCNDTSKTIETKEQPNILWLVLEDMSPQFVGAYGNTSAKTPVIDSLINAGTKFEAAFSTGAVCSPSRYTIITGTRTFEYGTGHHRSDFPIPDHVEPFPKFLKDSGYHTSNNSKRDYNTSARRRITKTAWVESSGKAGWWNRDGKPFFSVFNFNNCHQSRTFTNPYDNYKTRILDQLDEDEIIKPEAIIIPNYYEDTPELRKELSRTYNAMKKTDNEVDSILKRLKKDNLVESTIIFIYSDHGGGALRTKSRGIALGHQVPMAVVFPEKYEHLNPFKEESTTSQPVTFEDLGPTVLALAGIEVPNYMTGKPFLGASIEKNDYAYCSSDRCGESTDLTRSVSDGEYFYTRVFYPGKSQMNWQKYFDYSLSRQLSRVYYNERQLEAEKKQPFENRPYEFLYNLKEDMWQTNNLAENPDYKATLQKLSNALDEKLMAAKDVHFVPEYLLDSISKTSTPYDFKMSNDYDFETIYSIANPVGPKNTTEKFSEALQSDNAIVRYWSLLRLSESDKKELEQNVLDMALSDSFPPNRILAASMLYKNFGSKKAKDMLESYLFDENLFLAELTIQQILYFKQDKAMEFSKAIERLSSQFKAQNKSNNVTESMDMFQHIFEGKPLVYKTHW